MQDESLLATIGAIYETTLTSGGWHLALDRVAALTGGNGAMLLVRQHGAQERFADLDISAMSTRYQTPEAEEYKASLFQGEELRWLDALAAAPPRTILSDTDVWKDRAVYDAIPTVHWLRELNLYHRCAARLCEHGGWRDIVAILYRSARAGIQDEEAAHFAAVLPHLARVVELQRPFHLLERRYASVLNVLDHLGIGVAIMTESVQLVLANREMQRILDAEDGLGLQSNGTLMVAGADATDTEASLRRAVATATQPGRPPGAAVTIARRSGLDPYVLEFVPLPAESMAATGLGHQTHRCVLALAIDPAHRAMISTDGLNHSYALTRAEAAVCHLITQGMTTNEIAEERAVTIGTVKSQTQAIFQKTRTRNRAELVRRALSIVPPLLDDRGVRTN